MKFSKDKGSQKISSTLKASVNLDLERAAELFEIPHNECFIAPVATMTTLSKSMVTDEQRPEQLKQFPKHVAMNIQHCLTKPGLEEYVVVKYYTCDFNGRRLTDGYLVAGYCDVNLDLFPTLGSVPDVFFTFRKKSRAIVVFTLYPVVVVCTSQ